MLGYDTNDFSGNGVTMSAAEIKELYNKLNKFGHMIHGDKSAASHLSDWHGLVIATNTLHRYYMFTKDKC